MKIEFLGTGGAMTIPRPLCSCRVCEEARVKGVPFSRSGPSLFVHEANLLFDTSEDIYSQINRSNIKQIDGVFYSHWHPDHVMGRRVLESLNVDWRNYPPKHTQTNVYLPEQVSKDFNTYLGSKEHLRFFENENYINLHELMDEDMIIINDTRITPFRLAEDYVYAFLLEKNDKRILIAMDELNNWKPKKDLEGLDLAILPIGIFEYHPLNEKRLFASDHPILQQECTFLETLDIIKTLKPKKTILTHVDEINGLSFNELLKLEKQLYEEGLNIEIAYDTLIADVE
ncbi:MULTISPECIES: MBL fold metallo-hydrolase [Bacillus]|uniref:MBL fold metallo-hydrolase n=1 Tax=Bacillus TaxID=1386 RepID=UPI000304E91D|nr:MULTISPECIES: MBL fold metallo-hydrolase [Bacillus]